MDYAHAALFRIEHVLLLLKKQTTERLPSKHTHSHTTHTQIRLQSDIVQRIESPCICTPPPPVIPRSTTPRLSDEIGHVHGHLVDLRVVELFDITHHTDVLVGDKVDCHTLTTESSTTTDTMNVVLTIGR